MSNYSFLLFFLPLYLFSQEQVSNLEHYGVQFPSDITRDIGFAHIDGVQYLLEENDSLTIYKYNNGDLVRHATILNMDCRNRLYRIIDPNRSLFEIRDGYYYRFFSDGLQIIDVAEGKIVLQFDNLLSNTGNINPVELYKNHLYYNAWKDGEFIRCLLDIDSGERVQLNLPANREYYDQIGDQVAGIDEDRQFYIYDTFSNVDSLIYESQTKIISIRFSVQDSSYVLLEEDGRLIKVDRDLNVIDLNCLIEDVSILRSFTVKANKLIAIYSHVEIPVRQNRIVVYDLDSCLEEMSFISGVIEYFATGIQFVENESNDQDYSILGFYGQHPADGFDEGLYYIIDHKNNKFTKIEDISYVYSHTPFVHNDVLYFVGTVSSIGSAFQFVCKQDLASTNISRHDPNGMYETYFSTIGYHEEDKLINVTNTLYEDPTVWSLDTADIFYKLQSLDFTKNLGVIFVDNVLLLEERIYFTTNGGLYSVFDESKEEIAFENVPTVLDYHKKTDIALYDQKLAIPLYDGENVIFKILDTKTGIVDSLIDKNVRTNYFVIAGPFIFYSNGNSNDTLHYLDLKTGLIQIIEELPYLVGSFLTKGINSAIYRYSSSVNSRDYSAILIDYDDNSFTELDIEFDYSFKVVPGYDDSFYFIDWLSSSDSIKIQLYKKDGEIRTIYSGPGRYYSDKFASHYPGNPVTLINLYYNSDTAILIADDLSNTEIFAIPHRYLNGVNSVIRDNFQDKFLFETKDSLGNHYWLYEAFQTPLEIEYIEDSGIRFSDLTDSLAVFIFQDDNNNVSLIKYDHKNQDKTIIDSIEFNCGKLSIQKGDALNETQYLVVVNCELGNEPWILDIDKGTLELLADLNPGRSSSSPNNFIRFDKWILFYCSSQRWLQAMV